MADPYVSFAPKQVGPCSASWFVGSASGSPNDSPTFGPATDLNPIGAWDYLVDGPLKDVLTASYASEEAATEAWAAAGGEIVVSCTCPTPIPSPEIIVLAGGKPVWNLNSGLVAPDPALIWTVRFSVPHSIVK